MDSTEQEKQDKLYTLSDKDRPLTEDDVRIIVSQQLRNIVAPTVVQAGYLQSGNFVKGSTGWQLSPTGAEFQSVTIAGVLVNTKGTFGGDGFDGALAISSGTTTIDLASATVVVKNYTSISITGTGKLAFSNPNSAGTVVILKSQGDVTLTSSTAPMLDFSGLGGDGGVSVTNASGNDGTRGSVTFSYWYGGAAAGGGVKGNPGGGGGVGGTAIARGATFITSTDKVNSFKYPEIFIGSGAGSGAAYSGVGTFTSGSGGKGGGCAIIECGGAWNFTTALGISVKGNNGSSGSTSGGTQGIASGGGGGGGGFFMALYKTLTASSGSVNISGGDGGSWVTAGAIGSVECGGGGGGQSHLVGTGGGNGAPGANGGSGATGLGYIGVNNFFA